VSSCACLGPPGDCPCIRRARGFPPFVGGHPVSPDYSYTDIAKLTEERGSVYGPPKENFRRTAAMWAVIDECQHPEARVALKMIALKLARLIQSPDHVDSWRDVAGFAKCGEEVTR
jgi:hypothetical protein